MKPHPRVSATGLELVKRFEGLRRRSARLPEGGWTIGYGHTRSAREGVEVTEEEAEALLIYDLNKVSEALDAWCFTPLNQNQADALSAFAFNIGLEAFRTSQVLKWVNQGQLLQAAAALEMWRKADFEGESLVFDALIRRRAAEKALFLTPIDGFRPIPSPLLKPSFDPSVIEAADLRRAARVQPVQSTASLDGALAVLTVERSAPRPEIDTVAPAAAASDAAALSPTAAAANLSERLNRLLGQGETPIPAAVDPAIAGSSAAQEAKSPPSFVSDDPPPPPMAAVPAQSEPLDPFVRTGQALEADDAFSGPFGRRARPSAPEISLPEIEGLTSRVFVLGLLGLAMVLGSLIAMLGGRSSLTSLVIGLVGVLCLTPAAARFVTARLERRAARARNQHPR